MSAVVEGCELTQILFKKFGYLERRVTYLEEKFRGQQVVIEELQKKSRSQENFIHELQSELKNKTAARNQGHSSEEEFDESEDVDVNPNLDELTETEPIQNTIISGKDDKSSQKLVAQLQGTRCSEEPQRLENTCENSEVEKDHKSKISQCKTKSANKKVKTGGKSSKPKRKGKKAHICLFCSKSFPSFENLSDHVRIHTGEQPFNCKICSKSFNKMVNLKRHTRVHTGEKPFSCSVCSKSFAQKQAWNHHMRIHTGEKPYSCLVLSCPMSYSSYSGLRYHMSKHFGTFSCSICSKRFGQKYLLKNHEKVHTEEMSATKNSFEEEA